MGINLFGDPFGLQGGGGNMQGGYNPQTTGNPQQVYGPVQNTPRPVAVAPRPVTPRPVVAPRQAAPTPQPAPIVQPVAINPAYSPYVQTRASKTNPGVLEYYNPANQMGFSNPQDVFNYLRTMTGQSISDLSQLSAQQNGYTGAVLPTPTQTPTQTADPNQQFAQSAAQAGLSVDDYLKYVTGGVSPDERNNVNNQLGIPALQNQLFTPAPSTQDLYNNAYKSAGLSDLKAKIDAKLSELNARQQIYIDKAGTLNENPFLSEASRVGRLRTLDDKRLADIGNLNNEVQSLSDLYNNGISEVNSVVGRTTQDFSNNQQINASKLQYLQQQSEQQLQDLQGKKKTEAYKYLPDYLKAKANAQKPDTIGSNETGFYRWNPSTGTFEQVVAGYTKPENQLDNAKKLLEIQKLQSEIANGGMTPLDRQYKEAQIQKLQQDIANPKPATDTQNQAAGFALRVSQSNEILKNLESSIQGYDKFGFAAQMRLPSSVQSGTIQSYNQAARGFINALLRRESGAAIAPSEFDSYVKQYIPQPGDTTQTLSQKAADRNAALQGLVNSSGSAYGNLTGNNLGGSVSDPLGLFNKAGNASASIGSYAKSVGSGVIISGSPYHNGLERDIDGKIGDSIPAYKEGTVVKVIDNGKSGYGKEIVIQDSQGNRIVYGHLNSFSVKQGQQIAPGQVIGTIGNTGNVIASKGGDGSHLHIEQRDKNNKIIALS